MADTLLDPAELNRQGITCLTKGSSQDAVQCFKHALLTMKASLGKCSRHLGIPELVHPRLMYDSIDLQSQEDRFYICSRLMVFPSRKGAIEVQDYPLYSALVLFNIGIAYQTRSSRDTENEERSTQDAIYFYNMSLHILTSLQPHYRPNVLAPIRLAALNNLATATYQQGNARTAHDILSEAYELLNLDLMMSEDNDVCQDDLDGVTLNAVMMRWTFAAACA